MKTFLAQNQFLSAASLQPVAEAAASSPLGSLSEAAVTNSAPVATPAADTAATNLCVQRSVAAEAIHSLGVVVDRGTAQRLEIELRNAGYFSGPTASGAVWHGENGCSDPATPCDLTRPSQFNDEPALDVPPGPRLPAAVSTAAAGLSDDDLYWQLRFADDPFTRDLPAIPDPHAFFDAITDPIWADDAPLFLKDIA